jgi:hypothetical protein
MQNYLFILPHSSICRQSKIRRILVLTGTRRSYSAPDKYHRPNDVCFGSELIVVVERIFSILKILCDAFPALEILSELH